MVPTEFRLFLRYGLEDGRARYSMFIASWSRCGIVYAVAWAFGHLLLKKEAS
jgi:hypothetical protein